jgi:hypothetical protein
MARRRRGAGPAASATPTDYTPLYTKREVPIPMRDGVRLFTAVYAPSDTVPRHPILMVRTPYSSGPYGADRLPSFFRNSTIPAFRNYLRAGYIFVFQDVRGRYLSEGEFVDVRPYIEHKSSNQDVDETSDTWDTVEWLVRDVPGNNGRVGGRSPRRRARPASTTALRTATSSSWSGWARCPTPTRVSSTTASPSGMSWPSTPRGTPSGRRAARGRSCATWVPRCCSE